MKSILALLLTAMTLSSVLADASLTTPLDKRPTAQEEKTIENGWASAVMGADCYMVPPDSDESIYIAFYNVDKTFRCKVKCSVFGKRLSGDGTTCVS